MARAAAEKALALDSTLAVAHTSVGIVRLVYDWDWTGAEREFRRGLELQPGDANAHLWLGHLLVLSGRFDQGIVEIRKALELDPVNLWVSANLGWHLYFARRYDEAATHLENALRLEPNFYVFHVFLGLVREQRGDHAGAVSSLEKAVSLDVNNDDLSQLAYVYGRAGRRRDAERVIGQLLARAKQGFVPGSNLAIAYSGLGARDDAFRWLDRAIEDHSEFLIMLKVDPMFDPLRSDPRYEGVLQRVGLSGGAQPTRPRARV
jgi:Flp pilus assembly protein TadD